MGAYSDATLFANTEHTKRFSSPLTDIILRRHLDLLHLLLLVKGVVVPGAPAGVHLLVFHLLLPRHLVVLGLL